RDVRPAVLDVHERNRDRREIGPIALPDDLLTRAVPDDTRLDRILDAILEARRDLALRAAHGQGQTLARGDERPGHPPVGVTRDGLEQRRFPGLSSQRGEMPRIDGLLDALELARGLERAEKIAEALLHEA